MRLNLHHFTNYTTSALHLLNERLNIISFMSVYMYIYTLRIINVRILTTSPNEAWQTIRRNTVTEADNTHLYFWKINNFQYIKYKSFYLHFESILSVGLCILYSTILDSRQNFCVIKHAVCFCWIFSVFF